MKKLFALLIVFGALTFGQSNEILANEDSTATETTQVAENDSAAQEEAAAAPVEMKKEEPAQATDEAVEEERTFHQIVKEKFIEGGPMFMSFVLISLILGLAIAIERIIYLSLATTNTKKLVSQVEEAIKTGGIDAAKEVCRSTRGPVASIFYQGLERVDEGLDMVEKSVQAYGSVQMGLLEKGLSWISLFIALAPMLGFFGTVVGMIEAFDAIAAANNISPGIVAGGIGVALITTVSGLLVAMILQVFYNYIVAKIDSIVNDMEDASISLIDILIKNKNA
ncbi:MAG: MotA/TolQ/ExbB proton channel family protein [Bacteroidetes bacterium]|nr:MAG: MotA/TolQ/ExbB proton channel family protein [Bacteroidota bacterium]